jgi:hypothetical protein
LFGLGCLGKVLAHCIADDILHPMQKRDMAFLGDYLGVGNDWNDSDL